MTMLKIQSIPLDVIYIFNRGLSDVMTNLSISNVYCACVRIRARHSFKKSILF